MKRLLTSAGLALALCVGLTGPALAQRDNPEPDVAPTDRVTTQPVETAPTDVRPVDEPRFEELRLACHGRSSDDGRAGVACEWSRTELRAAAGYALVRTDGDVRTTVFATRDLDQTTAVDTEVRLGVVYHYAVLVLDDAGSTIGRGGPVRAGVRAPDTDVEVLTLHCEAIGAEAVGAVADAAKAARCEWRPATSRAAVGYQLWRIVDREERELVWRGGLDQTAARDLLPRDALVARYAVLAVDEQGEIVGRSRPVTLRFADGPVDHRVDRVAARLHANSYR